MTASGIFADLRRSYHELLCRDILGLRGDGKVYTIADGGSVTSMELAERLVAKIAASGIKLCTSAKTGQEVGRIFTEYTMAFLNQAFARLSHIRPGRWVYRLGPPISEFDQYEHLARLKAVADKYQELREFLSGDYIIVPDIVVSRSPVSDEEINTKERLVAEGDGMAVHTPLRARQNQKEILHASISCKWTIRSDRAQNTRTEALNLVRNRKGRAPHMVAVMFEPLPTRIASLARGTGDLDCCYHGALPELIEAVKESTNGDQQEALDDLVSGRRLRDITDLPFDLAV